MPNYDYECSTGHIFEIYQSFQEDSLTTCPEHDAPVTKIIYAAYIASAARPTSPGAIQAVQKNEYEKSLEKDLPAYKRLRKQGFQPKSTVGAAALEAGATTKFEVQSGKIAKEPKKLQQAVDMFEQTMGHSVFTPQVKPKGA